MEIIDILKNKKGFIAALDQSGGSSKRTLANYGISEELITSDDVMFDFIHEMRSRIIKSDVFDERILGVILFKNTMERDIDGVNTVKYLSDKGIVSFLKIDVGLEDIDGGVQLLKDIPNLEENFSELKDMEGYHCKNCGADIIVQKNTTSTRCVYCRSYSIIKNRLTGVYKPSSIIPFKVVKEDAIQAFKDICKKRPLIPKDFSDINNIQDMEGLYVPFFLYDLENDCYLLANCTKVRSWVSGDYRYTETSYYKAERGGNLVYKDVPNDASVRFDDKIMNAIEPFDYSKMVDFETSYLSGYLAEKYDVKMVDAYKNVLERVKTDSKNYLQKDMRGYS